MVIQAIHGGQDIKQKSIEKSLKIFYNILTFGTLLNFSFTLYR